MHWYIKAGFTTYTEVGLIIMKNGEINNKYDYDVISLRH